MLTVRVSGGGRVLLWLTRFAEPHGFYPFWLIIGPADKGHPRMWDALTDADVLADAVGERVRAYEEQRAELSPWRWDEPDGKVPIVRLADALEARGYDVRLVVSANRIRTTETVKGIEAFPYRAHEGGFVVVGMGRSSVRVSRKPKIGWLVDVHDEARDIQWRPDIHSCFRGETGVVPGSDLTEEMLDELHGVIERALREDPPEERVVVPRRKGELPRAGGMQDQRHASPPASRSTVRELRTLGFGDVIELDAGADSPASLTSESLAIVQWERDKALGLADIKMMYADATVSGKRLLVLLRRSMTRPASNFADQANVFAYWADESTGSITPYSRAAEEAAFAEV
jgi:hypothetical protein